MLDVVITIATERQASQHEGLLVALAAALLVESAVLGGWLLRTGYVSQGPMVADLAFLVAVLYLNAALLDPRQARTWAFFAYGFSLLACVAFGIAFRRLVTVLAAATVLSVGYLVSALGYQLEPGWNALPDTFGYFGSTTVTWVVARELRRSASAFDRERALALDHAEARAQSEERARQARLLHDRVLQTLEVVARSRALTDTVLQAHVAAEAVRVRAQVENDLTMDESTKDTRTVSDPADLATQLTKLAYRHAELGLHVQLHDSALHNRGETGLSAVAVDALTGATEEALTNVAKHAGVDTAVVRVDVADTAVTVSILDHGLGFDPSLAKPGLGLNDSIHQRLRAAGGHAQIESQLTHGTYVRLSAPIGTQSATTTPVTPTSRANTTHARGRKYRLTNSRIRRYPIGNFKSW